MKISQIMAAVLTVSVTALVPAHAQDSFEKNIMTGGASGTYIQVGRDIDKLGQSCGLELNVQESAGSLENILAVRDRRNTQFGIVQSDVLNYLETYSKDDVAIQRAISGVVIAAPLYNEEIQVLAKRDIKSLADLAGKRVSVGVQDSGTFLTSSLVLDLTKTKPGELANLNAKGSLEALKNDEIDAFFYVSGAPTSLFTNGEIDGEKFHILPLTHEALKSTYTTTELPAGTYPFQKEKVDLVAVKAVLMTYDYDINRNTYHKLSCDAVSDYSHLIVSNFKGLKENGHPKWNNVDLSDIPPGWSIGNCVNRGLEPNYTSSCTARLDAASKAEETNANDIYRARICKTLGGC